MKKFTIMSTLLCVAMFTLNFFINEPAKGKEIRDSRFCVCLPQGCMCTKPEDKK